MKFLLVEDYPPLRKNISTSIREQGWAIDVSADGEEGLWFAENNQYDAIVLDLMLPKLNGLQILSHLRTNKITTPVLILTARDAVEQKMQGLDQGADDYMTKPFFMGELISRLKALVRRSYQQSDPVVMVGDLSVDTSARRVCRSDREIDLSAREYALLEYLVRRAGKITTRTEIWDHVYESYGGASSNVVDVYVGYLRKKLHLPGLEPIIHTKRGQGYLVKAGSS